MQEYFFDNRAGPKRQNAIFVTIYYSVLKGYAKSKVEGELDLIVCPMDFPGQLAGTRIQIPTYITMLTLAEQIFFFSRYIGEEISNLIERIKIHTTP